MPSNARGIGGVRIGGGIVGKVQLNCVGSNGRGRAWLDGCMVAGEMRSDLFDPWEAYRARQIPRGILDQPSRGSSRTHARCRHGSWRSALATRYC